MAEVYNTILDKGKEIYSYERQATVELFESKKSGKFAEGEW